jgi:hypothetical protein
MDDDLARPAKAGNDLDSKTTTLRKGLNTATKTLLRPARNHDAT